MSTHSECTSGAGLHEHQFPQRDGSTRSPRAARTPLRRSARENVYPDHTDRSGGSPIKMSMLVSSPHGSRTPKTPKTAIARHGSPDSSPQKSAAEISLQKQCADLYTRLSTITNEYKHLEDELSRKGVLVDELTQKMLASERHVRALEEERRAQTDLQQQEVQLYQESIDELRRQNKLLSQRLEQAQQAQMSRDNSTRDVEEKYAKLLKTHQALQSNYELERNSKALLINQIEFLTKERDFLVENASPTAKHESFTPQNCSSDSLESYLAGQNSDVEPVLGAGFEKHDQTGHSDSHEPDSGSDSDSDGSVHGTQLLSSYAELAGPGFDSSSPIKSQTQDFLELAAGFQFPPPKAPTTISEVPSLVQDLQHEQPQNSLQTNVPPFSPPNPDEKAKTLKRQSLPAQLKLNSSFDGEFVLSPLKLTSHANSSYFDDSSKSSTNTRPNSIATRPNSFITKRYSGTKPTHSRYNSHDIVPIKVEFEQQLRSSSAPDKEIAPQLSSVAEGNPIEDSDLAFMKLNGFHMPSKRDSLMTDSSKRSSFFSELNLSSGDVTKQEITKLKFELQSLRLHNEKLLSYIGFELQKQKKNIKKLSSKQNLRPKPSHPMEYSDAKLIERSKEMLIHKKRVLRSVSINPILSTKYGGKRSGSSFQPLVGLGVLGNTTEDEDDFVFRSPFINSIPRDDCDDYGFLNHSCKYDSRVLSKLDQHHSQFNGQHTVKKHKSQTFRRPHAVLDLSSGDESCLSIDEEPDLEDGEFQEFDAEISDIHKTDGSGNEKSDSNADWESSSEGSLVSDVDYDKLNRFNQMKYLLLGKEHMKKNKQAESIADENLTYKFLTIAIGIVIVGIKFTSHPQHQLTSN
ncbi:hypothetical protein OXX80_001171 [Metschnikowia pulcherrima]